MKHDLSLPSVPLDNLVKLHEYAITNGFIRDDVTQRELLETLSPISLNRLREGNRGPLSHAQWSDLSALAPADPVDPAQASDLSTMKAPDRKDWGV